MCSYWCTRFALSMAQNVLRLISCSFLLRVRWLREVAQQNTVESSLWISVSLISGFINCKICYSLSQFLKKNLIVSNLCGLSSKIWLQRIYMDTFLIDVLFVFYVFITTKMKLSKMGLSETLIMLAKSTENYPETFQLINTFWWLPDYLFVILFFLWNHYVKKI